MSDAMTNREIEDVLTSIRRLVAQEGSRPTDAGRLILTEDQRVTVLTQVATVPESAQVSQGHRPVGPGKAATAGSVAGVEATGPGPSRADQQAEIGAAPPARDLILPEPDFGKLEATIAELEAAVSASGEAWDPEAGPDDAPRPSNVTDLYGRLSFVHRGKTDGTEPFRGGPEATPRAAADLEGPGSDLVAPEADLRTESAPTGDQAMSAAAPVAGGGHESETPHPASPAQRGPEPAPGRDESREGGSAIDAPPTPTAGPPQPEAETVAGQGAMDTSEPEDAELIEEDTFLDEAALRALVAQIVREELHGQLGERVTQQVRKLVRSEIAKALEDRDFL